MPKTKVAVTIEAGLIDELDALVLQQRFANRSQAIEAAVSEQLVRMRRTRLAEACALLDPAEERALAEEGGWGWTSTLGRTTERCGYDGGRFDGLIWPRYEDASRPVAVPC